MQLYMPTKIYSEKNCVVAYGKELRALGTKAMIVTGKTSAVKTGALADVVQALEQTPYVIFDQIEENPSIETALQAQKIAAEEKVDFFIGIGGGSAMDAAKAISLLAKNFPKGEEILYDPAVLPYYPVACVPTTCGTGSEATPYAILTIHKKQTKKSISHRIYPALSLMDDKYLRFMPRHILVNTCVDALAHLLESYLNTNTNELNRVYSREGLMMWRTFRDRLLQDQVTEADYRAMLHASMLAGCAITHTGTSLPHGLSYAVTYHLGVPHGRAVGIFLGGYVDGYGNAKEATEAVKLLGFETTAQFRKYMQSLLGKAEIPADLLQTAAKMILADPGKMKNCPFPMTEEDLIGMLN